jgi:RNA polymerase sigma-70 factor (ECF subfamily)
VTPEQAFDRYHQAVYRFAWRLTRRADLAEDITQECFLAFLRAPGRFDPARGSAKTYLFAIARNLALKHHRDARPEEPLEDMVAESFSPDLAAAVEQAVASLPVLQQEAIVLFEYEGFTLEEIAEVAEADPGTIKSRLHRARERLKRALAPCRGYAPSQQSQEGR